MTHATKAVMKLLLSDNIKLQFKQNPLYNEKVPPPLHISLVVDCINKCLKKNTKGFVELRG